MWYPKTYTADLSKTIILHVCRVKNTFGYDYYIKGVGVQPPNLPLGDWIPCSLSKQQLLAMMPAVEQARSISKLAMKLYLDYQDNEAQKAKEKAILETEGNLQTLFTLFE